MCVECDKRNGTNFWTEKEKPNVEVKPAPTPLPAPFSTPQTPPQNPSQAPSAPTSEAS